MIPLYDTERAGKRAYVTWSLIAVNLAVFVGELVWTSGLQPCKAEQLFYTLGLVPYSIVHGTTLSFNCATGHLTTAGNAPAAYFTLLSSLFLHAGYLHVGGNMLFLFVFGDNIESRFGRLKFLVAYFAAGFAGSAAVLGAALAAQGQALIIPGLGASGAISGVMAAYLVLYPNSRIISIVGYFVIPIRALWFIGFWFFLQVFYQVAGLDTGVSYVAHVAGFLIGLLAAFLVRAMAPGSESVP